MRFVEWTPNEVCNRAQKRLYRLHVVHKEAPYGTDLTWLYLSGIIVALDNLIIQVLESYSRSLLRQADRSGDLKQTFQGKDWGKRDFDNVVLSIFEAGKVDRANRDNFDVSKLPPYIIKKPAEFKRLIGYVSERIPSEVDTAVSANFPVFTEIKPFRNFYAHQCEATARKLRIAVPELRGFGARKPEDLLLKPRSRNRKPLLDIWTEDVNDFLSLLRTK